MDFAIGNGLVHRAHGHLHIGADIHAANINIYPGIWHRAFALDAHGTVHHLYRRQLTERNLRTRRRGHHNVFAQGPEIGTKIAVIAEIDGIALQAFHRGGQRHAAEGDGEHILHVSNRQAIAGDGVAIDFKLDEAPAHHAFGKGAAGAGNFAHHRLNLGTNAFQPGEVRPGDLDAHGRLDTGGKHVYAGANGHGPRIV